MSQTQLDLQGLAIDRGSSTPGTSVVRRPRRSYLARYILPGTVLLGFVVLVLNAAGTQLLPRHRVSVVPVVVRQATVQQAGTPLFQAAGWIEPRPTPINVPALTEGVVDELFVVEGQDIAQGESIASLIDTDAKLDVQQAEATRDFRKAELARAEATLAGARVRFENPAHWDAALAEANSALAQTLTAKAQLPYLTRAAEAKVDYTEQNLARKRAAGAAVAARTVDLAESDHARALANLKELKQRPPLLEREAEALRAKVAAVQKQRELLVEESRQLEEARAAVEIAKARLAQARLAVEAARLALERTVIRAPVDGRVLRLVAHTGTRVMGLSSNAKANSSTVITMYDPQSLQVRADVRLGDVPLVRPGQPVEIETATSNEILTGHVLLSTSEASVQKNTLEVKVAIDDPPDWVRPEMLVTATFIAPPTELKSEKGSDSQQRLLVPRKLVNKSEEDAFVWIVTPDGYAERRNVKLGRAGTEDLIAVLDGLDPTSKLISSNRQGLENGMRITIANALR